MNDGNIYIKGTVPGLETAECGLDRLKVNISFGSKHL